MTQHQGGILADVPPVSRYLQFNTLVPGANVRAALAALTALVDGEQLVVGLGPMQVAALGARVEGLHELTVEPGAVEKTAVTPAALWCWLRGEDRGDLLHRGRQVEKAVAGAMRMPVIVDGFRHREGRDLTGYVDGTENPDAGEAPAVAFVSGRGQGLDGSSFVAVQQWVHNFDRFEAMSTREQDDSIGRRRSDNEELDDAPPSAHVKRTAQESFDPEAFVLRRSMPWAQDGRAGLMFVAFGHSLNAFEAQMRRMVGAEDGVVDALFRFTRPISGAAFWCPPMRDGRLDLSALGIQGL